MDLSSHPRQGNMRTRCLLMAVFLLAAALPDYASAQEIDPTIQVNLEAVPTTHRDLLVNFEDDLRTYLTAYNWGGGETGERVKCAINVFVKGVLGENRYSAQVF